MKNVLLATTDNQHLGFGIHHVGVNKTLRSPTMRTDHVAIALGKLGEAMKRLEGGVEGPDLPAGRGENEVHESTRPQLVGIEGEMRLNKRKVGVGTFDSRSWCDESDVFDRRGGKEVLRRGQNLGLEVESAVVPSDGRAIAPHTCRK